MNTNTNSNNNNNDDDDDDDNNTTNNNNNSNNNNNNNNNDNNNIIIIIIIIRVSPSGGDWGGIPPTSQNFDKSPLTKILSLPITVLLHLVWHPLPSISESPSIIWYI